ncbi:MAG: inositol monophosphatase [Fimbriimonadia bacterium]|jgi:hypothetical protein
MNLVFVRDWDDGYYVEKLRELGLRIRGSASTALAGQNTELLQQVARESEDDTIYRLDEGVEGVLAEFCAEWGRERSFVLVAEGLPGGREVFPHSAHEGEAEFVLIVDPVDGTRSLMFDKRAAWTLCAVAPMPSEGMPTSRDIRVAVQTEIPTTRQCLAAQIWAVAGGGTTAEMHDLRTGHVSGFEPRPSRASGLQNGFAGFAKFFPEGKTRIAELEWELFQRVLPPNATDRVFDDQYVSSGGQLYELIVGHDLFVADIRSVLFAREGRGGLCPHPYDLCTEMIAREAGVIVTGLDGQTLDFSLDTTTPVGWAGYANEQLRALVEPHLLDIVRSI